MPVCPPCYAQNSAARLAPHQGLAAGEHGEARPEPGPGPRGARRGTSSDFPAAPPRVLVQDARAVPLPLTDQLQGELRRRNRGDLPTPAAGAARVDAAAPRACGEGCLPTRRQPVPFSGFLSEEQRLRGNYY